VRAADGKEVGSLWLPQGPGWSRVGCPRRARRPARRHRACTAPLRPPAGPERGERHRPSLGAVRRRNVRPAPVKGRVAL